MLKLQDANDTVKIRVLKGDIDNVVTLHMAWSDLVESLV